jgi:hypothetical protein
MRMIMEDVLTSFQENLIQITKDIDDPDEKLAAAFDIYLRVVDRQRDKALIVYQASKSLDKPSRTRVMQLELDVANIFATIITKGLEKGIFKKVDIDLTAYNMMMLAHMWVLKRWHFKNRLDLNQYIELQLEIIRDILKK